MNTEGNACGLPCFGSLDELIEFFDAHDMGDYLDEMPEVNFAVMKGVQTDADA